jgi:hypothetical protein
MRGGLALRDRRDHLVDAHADEPHRVQLVAFVALPAERREAEEHPERRQTGDRTDSPKVRPREAMAVQGR